nr:hypothetical protein [Thioalkalivibrio sp.]
MHFDNFTLLGITAALAIGGLTIRLMMPERNDSNRRVAARGGMTGERNRFLRS